MAIIPQIYEDSVVAIGVNRGNRTQWIATGFVVARSNENGGYNTFLVSNKHVFDCGREDLMIRFNFPGKIQAKDYLVKLLENGNKNYSVHPDSRVDVACMIINPNILSKDLGPLSAFRLDIHTLTRKEMIENEIVEGTFVLSMGFPSGLVGANSKIPLCRMGCISQIKEALNGNGYLVDMQNFPGSSGSPIINRIETTYLDGTKCYDKTMLIGVVASYLPFEDELISSHTGKVMQKTSENSGIAVVYDVDAIKETVEVEFNRVKKALHNASTEA